LSEINGTNGHASQVVVSTIELMDAVARYRTALVALLALIRRDGGYMDVKDQMLLREVERLIGENPR
jgi:hypothetical protein